MHSHTIFEGMQIAIYQSLKKKNKQKTNQLNKKFLKDWKSSAWRTFSWNLFPQSGMLTNMNKSQLIISKILEISYTAIIGIKQRT